MADVGCSSEQAWVETLGDWGPDGDAEEADGPRVIALDCGAKRNILRNLTSRGCRVRVVPHDISGEALAGIFERGEADGLFISNGPGDPSAVAKTIEALRTVVSGPAERVPPTFGICLGHQLLSLALGASTYKLPFGHRGTNQPVHDTETGRVEITSQNHGFAVEPASMDAIGAIRTHVHLTTGQFRGSGCRTVRSSRSNITLRHRPARMMLGTCSIGSCGSCGRRGRSPGHERLSVITLG